MSPRVKLSILVLSFLLVPPDLARADGEPDGSFGTEGVVIDGLGSATNRVAAVAGAPDGRIVVAGDVVVEANRDLFVAAFLPSGAVDESFAGTGRVTADFSGDETASGVAVHRDGSIVVVGTRDKDDVQDIVLVRYRPNGELDTTLAGSGRRVLTLTDDASNLGAGVAFDLHGRIVVGGTRGTALGSVLAVARMLPDGELDTTFNGNGKRFVDFGIDNGTDATGSAVAVQDDGKIVVAGTRVGAGGSDFAVARLNPDGNFDEGFDGSGKTAIDFGGTDVAHALAIRPDGQIVVGGVRTTEFDSDFAIAVLREDGQLDLGFKGNGKATTDFGADEGAYAVAVQADGKIVAVGDRQGPTGLDFAVARYFPDGNTDPALDGDGKLRIDLGEAASDSARGVALQGDGLTVVAGTSTLEGVAEIALTRRLATVPSSPGVLEIPSMGTKQSGIGLVSGWLCDAPSVGVRIDGRPLVMTSYGTTRGDTSAICGDANNGFGLLFNWALLGDGPHVIRAFANGVQFATSVFDVQTLGTPFLAGASGEYTLSDFPTAGASVDLAWAEGLQRFVIRDFSASGAAAATTSAVPPARPANTQGMLENPTTGSFQSGIGVISGWICDATDVQIRIDDRPPVRAAYGTTRGDTQAICGDANNGFGLLFNWALLGDGPHTIEVRADGVVLGTATFDVTTLGTTFLRGASGSYTLEGFPQTTSSVDVAWDEGQQGFVVVGMD
jgi:uncharacterized delta-60 repeat protein